MSSAPSNPKHKLRKCNVKKKKNKHREKILIEKLKELTLSSKHESAQKGCNRYIKMQKGGLSVFCGMSRY